MAEQEKAGDGSQKSKVKIGEKQQKPKVTIHMLIDMIADAYGNRLRYNEITGRPEYLNSANEWEQWTDVCDARMAAYFQTNFGIYAPKMLEQATMIHFDSHKVNPVTELLESLQWDGIPRVERFLAEVLRCDDTPYTAECSRLIFAGGIHRAYRPGCKFDDMIVLVGGQGTGKSTVVRFLNMEDRFYSEIKTIDGKEGIEALRGVWIGEVAELMAMTRAKEVEAVKAYITTQADSYRPPYQRHVVTVPRRCVFVGTTNNPQFLTDKTGNRRFYPVRVNSNGYELLDNEKKISAYIRQCWAEAVYLYKAGNLQPYAKKEVLDAIRAAQQNALEDDWRIGAIQQYLDDFKKKPNDTVSVIELWYNALNQPQSSKPEKKDSTEITQILNSMPGWEKCENLISTRWGRQRGFRKKNLYFPFWQ